MIECIEFELKSAGDILSSFMLTCYTDGRAPTQILAKSTQYTYP